MASRHSVMVAADGPSLLLCCRLLFDRYTHHISPLSSHLVNFYRAIPIPTAATAAARVERAAPPREAREVMEAILIPIHTAATADNHPKHHLPPLVSRSISMLYPHMERVVQLL